MYILYRLYLAGSTGGRGCGGYSASDQGTTRRFNDGSVRGQIAC